MSRLTDTQADMQAEETLRRLALNISATIQQCRDVLENRVVDVPVLSGAEFIPPDQNGLKTLPSAFQFVEGLTSLSHRSSMQQIFEQFRIVEKLLIWGHAPGYNKDNVGQEFLDNYCHALLTGPDGPLKCASPLGAFVLFGPDTLYKDHSHAPNEVYLALTGDGEWRVGHHDWKRLDAGQTIYIPSNAVHAIRTSTKPLLTFSFWLEAGEMDEIVI